MFNKVWSCVRCGKVYKHKYYANTCCGGHEEENYKCNNCGVIFDREPNYRGHKCPECKK